MASTLTYVFNQLAGGTTISSPLVIRTSRYITPDNYEMLISADIFAQDLTLLQSADDLLITSTILDPTVIKTYLANGASWGEQSPKVVVQKILDSLDEKSILNRIKAELRAKLGSVAKS